MRDIIGTVCPFLMYERNMRIMQLRCAGEHIEIEKSMFEERKLSPEMVILWEFLNMIRQNIWFDLEKLSQLKGIHFK